MPVEIAERRKKQQKLKDKVSLYIDKARELYNVEDSDIEKLCEELVKIASVLSKEFGWHRRVVNLIDNLVMLKRDKTTIYKVLKVLGYKLKR